MFSPPLRLAATPATLWTPGGSCHAPHVTPCAVTHMTHPNIGVMAAAGLSYPYGASHCFRLLITIHIIILIILKKM